MVKVLIFLEVLLINIFFFGLIWFKLSNVWKVVKFVIGIVAVW